MPKSITRETLFKSHRKRITVEFTEPEYDFAITLRELSIGESLSMKEPNIIKLLSMMIVNEDGDLIFTTDDDLRNLGDMGSGVLAQLTEAAKQVNGTGKKSMEDAAKNLLASQTADSSGDSLAS